MSKKRSKANGEGTIYKVKNGYRGQFTVDRKANGSLIRKSFSGKTKIEVYKQRDAYMASVQNGTYVDDNKTIVEDWLLYWLETFKKNSITPSYYDTLEYHIIKHLIPNIGNIKLQKLTTGLLMEMFNEIYESGRLDGKGGLSANTIKQIHVTLSMALDKAVSNDLISKNPADACELKYTDNVDKKLFYTIDEQERIINAVNPDITSHLLSLTCMMTGLRKGEVIPLTWDDIDFNNLLIYVNKAITTYKNRDKDSAKKLVTAVKNPKTRHSKRAVPITPELAFLLNNHKQNIIKKNLAAGRSNKDYNIVFQTRNGTLLNESNVNKAWDRILKKANVDHVKFHGTRHSYITRLLETNLTPKVVQTNVGHSKVATTTDIYGHVTSTMVDSSRDAISKVFNIKSKLSTGENEISEDEFIKESSPQYIAI